MSKRIVTQRVSDIYFNEMNERELTKYLTGEYGSGWLIDVPVLLQRAFDKGGERRLKAVLNDVIELGYLNALDKFNYRWWKFWSWGFWFRR